MRGEVSRRLRACPLIRCRDLLPRQEKATCRTSSLHNISLRRTRIPRFDLYVKGKIILDAGDIDCAKGGNHGAGRDICL